MACQQHGNTSSLTNQKAKLHTLNGAHFTRQTCITVGVQLPAGIRGCGATRQPAERETNINGE
jgi:hypothetical protein